ncbi:hypothetical protein D5125_15085 [Magnetovirga frankeli]|uniref:hypothetical protein n=1 Tax=Magnetovirga frankeli TaxID=947516 RepID=UPI001292E600|nr:hypothetical protein D5125_15085 [gamma proteobacterium SS-5]
MAKLDTPAPQFDDVWRSIQALAESQKETDRQIRELKQQIGGLGDKFSYFTEGMALPAIVHELSRWLTNQVREVLNS